MAAAEIIIIQGGIGAPAGQSNDELVTGQVVELRNSDIGNSGVGSWRWTLVARPLDSTAVLLNAQSAVAQFTPDQPGTYRIRLDVNGGGDVQTQQRLGVVRATLGGGTLASLAVRIPAAGEAAEANWPGNVGGWWSDFALFMVATGAAYVAVDTLSVDVDSLDSRVTALESPPAPTVVPGSAAGPTKSDSTFATVPDMSAVVPPGCDVAFVGSMLLAPASKGATSSGEVRFALDGTPFGPTLPFAYTAGSVLTLVPGQAIIPVTLPRQRVPSAGTVTVEWRATAGTIEAVGTARQLSVY